MLRGQGRGLVTSTMQSQTHSRHLRDTYGIDEMDGFEWLYVSLSFPLCRLTSSVV
jgi:hypothetical protein